MVRTEAQGGAERPLEWDEDRDLPFCSECVNHLSLQPLLVAACASVGIEHGKSTGQMLREYLESFHANRHREDRP